MRIRIICLKRNCQDEFWKSSCFLSFYVDTETLCVSVFVLFACFGKRSREAIDVKSVLGPVFFVLFLLCALVLCKHRIF